MRAIAIGFVLALILFAGGFIWFVGSIRSAELKLDRKADGIVVLTGGASRVADGIALLSAGQGRRLLISGVHPTTSPAAMSRVLPEHRKLFACCVDLDRSAQNTMGNAIEAARWVEQQKFRSVIVVTSNYHMPRALLEFSERMPGVALYSYPVVADTWRNAPWWRSALTARLIASEYVKFLAAAARARLAALGLLPARFGADREDISRDGSAE